MTRPDLEEAARIAALVEADRVGRGVEVRLATSDDAYRFKHDVLAHLAAVGPPAHAAPWVWQAATSTGIALSEAGRETGVELRFEYRTRGLRI